VNDCFNQRAKFAARLPAGYLYTPSHFWLVAGGAPDRWRVGLTEFAVRMLGELVVVEFEKRPGTAVELGEVVGLVEGLKALSDLCCVGAGVFEGGNPALLKGLECVVGDPYGEGWLYEFSGEPDARRLDAKAYQELLGVTVSRLQAERCPDNQAP
jgi:glycine cleavage system H protein